MFYSYTGQETDMLSQAKHFYPNMDYIRRIQPANYSINCPYRIIISNMNLNDDEELYACTHIDHKAAAYSVNSREEVAPFFSSLKLHNHNFYEFMCVLDGELYVNIENRRHVYTKGCCCILNRNVMHSEEYNTNFQIVFLQLHPDFLASIYADLCLNIFDVEKTAPPSKLMEFLNMNISDSGNSGKDYVDFIPNTNDSFLTSSIHSIFDRLTRETLSPQIGSSIVVKNLIIKLFRFLSAPDNFNTTPIRIGTDAEYFIYSQIVKAMTETCGRISRRELAEKLNYSGTYLNEIAKKYSGFTLFDFGMTFCMKEAARLLRTTNENVTDIGSALGFSNRTHFYKIFKEAYGMTPAQYRRKMKINIK